MAPAGPARPGTPAWCEATGLPFPDRVNTVAKGQGLRVARLGTWELLVVPGQRATAVPGIPPGLPGVHDGYRDEGWVWLRVEGPEWRELLAGLTSTDLRTHYAPPGAVVQTRLGSLDAVLLIDADGVDIFADIASTDYLLALLRDG